MNSSSYISITCVFFLCLMCRHRVSGCGIMYMPPKEPNTKEDEVKSCRSPCEGVELVTRKEWGAAPSAGKLRSLNDTPIYVVIHHTGTPPCYRKDVCSSIVRAIQKDHMSANNWFDIGYHLLIGGDGRVYEGRPINKCGAHTKNRNGDSLSIAFIGTYDKECPKELSMAALRRVLRCSRKLGFLSPDFWIMGHRDVVCTPCPGDELYKLIKTLPRFLKDGQDKGVCDVSMDSAY